MLVLAACGAGGNGSGSPAARRAAVSQDTIDSNAIITGMVSEIGVASGGAHVDLGRAATGTVIKNGIEYTSYRLDDVDFKTFMTPGRGTDTLKFIVDNNGKIDGIKYIDNTGAGAEGYSPDVLYGKMARIGNSDTFDLASDDTAGEIQYISYAQEIGLSYSDFGVMRINGTVDSYDGEGNKTIQNIENADIAFTGGYDVKKIDKSELSADATFAGIAKGSVASAGDARFAQIEDKNATLVFNEATGSETLSADFSAGAGAIEDWYKIDVVKSNGTVTFSIDDTGKTIASDIQIPTPTADLTPDTFENPNSETVGFEANYYGENKTPGEATALFQYQYCPDGACDGGQNINAFIGFGGKAQ
jgi:hypothetical protein